MAIEGPLRELALSDVLQLLALSQKTGELTVRRDGERDGVAVFLEQGAVVGVRAAGQTRNIGELLLLAGKVTERQLSAAVAEQQRGRGALLGSILVGSHGVAATDVRRQLRFQIEELVFDLSRWNDGYFRFEERPPADWGPITVRLSTESLLMEAARQVDELAAIRNVDTQGDPVPALNDQLAAGGSTLDLQPLDWEVLAAIDGTRDLRALARELGRGEFEVAKAVFSLVSDGVVVLAKHGSSAGGAPHGQQDALSRAAGALDAGDLDAAEKHLEPHLSGDASGEALLLAGRLEGRRGRWTHALARFEQAVSRDPLLADAHCALGVAAVRAGELERAEEALGTCQRLPDLTPDRRDELLRLRRAVQELRSVLQELEP